MYMLVLINNLTFINTKSQILPAKFFVRFIYEHKSKFATKEVMKNFLPQIWVFVYEKMHIIQFLYTKII